jgi:hypothetical protein
MDAAEHHVEETKEEEAAQVMETTTAHSRFGRICVFCGSSQGKKKSYQDAAVELAEELVRLLPLLGIGSCMHQLSACVCLLLLKMAVCFVLINGNMVS